ncbi:MAG: moaA/nirJ/pqqE cofactor biosynthesis protein [Candidatus Scalindua rubra]|uniref:MoaA/nirJ/pqqE cofactor biosynthesis protein n=1 Tax=Candidatus Scalindua rubra TaxID=1872076 RepID=A0A1E3X2N3_9BACT|nr:MAG: moaA/nirJ/pqqE cofactor biosynthesis protein [Candidatus Scalindua rubra]
MAVGFSGSNGGITRNYEVISTANLKDSRFCQKSSIPMEVSYFINNTCNLKCSHCYVGYNDFNNTLSVQAWKSVFDELIAHGARTFGNVGKEPLLNWKETKVLLQYLKAKRKEKPELRLGLVTNGILLDKLKITELEDILPDYIDISLDGNRDLHDWIRGVGSYDKLMNNLFLLSESEILKKIFISFTLNKLNVLSIADVVKTVYNLGIKNILISPYVTLNTYDRLHIANEEIIKEIQKLLDGQLIDFKEYEGMNIYIKNDFSTTRDLMEEMASRNIINKNELLIDDYGVIFNKYSFNNNNIYFNYLPWDTSYIQAIRISMMDM